MVTASLDIMSGGRDEERKRGPRKPPFKFLVPLVYAPMLPLIRIGLRKQPVLRDRVFTVVLAAALLHGGYLVYPNHGMIDSIFVFCGYFVCRFMHLSLVVTLLSILYNVKGFSCLPSPDSVHFLLLRNGDSRGSIFKCASTGAFWCSVSFFLDKRCTDLISMMQKASHSLKVAHGSVDDDHASGAC